MIEDMRGQTGTSWVFLTNHARALFFISDNPQIRIRELASALDVTERAAQTIVNDLVDAQYVNRTRVGRRNRYRVRTEMPLRHPLVRDVQVGELIDLLGASRTLRSHLRAG
jgi:DNA-binding MarR family transcriptional regulator